MNFDFNITSRLVVAPKAQWQGLITEGSAGIHPADIWQPKDPEKPFPIAEVRELIRFSHRSPVGKKKIAFLQDADQFSPVVANALLKIIEEPPSYLSLVLLSQTNRLLPTLLSRLRQLAFPGDSATISSVFENLAIKKEADRQKAARLLYLYPLLHSGMKTDSLLKDL